mmetsp:Transcript_19095/g.50200  ORF Transcript_19095/g.50200 Transcript_19095/m.50200 type:complete len:136 (+) Transcript_19095:3-410(+)
MYSDGRAMEAERTMLTDDAIWEIYPSTIGSRVGGGLPKQAHMAFMEQTMEGFSNFSIRPFDMVCEGAVVQTNARSEGRHKLVGHFSQEYAFMFKFAPDSSNQIVLVREFVDSAYTMEIFAKIREAQAAADGGGRA